MDFNNTQLLPPSLSNIETRLNDDNDDSDEESLLRISPPPQVDDDNAISRVNQMVLDGLDISAIEKDAFMGAPLLPPLLPPNIATAVVDDDDDYDYEEGELKSSPTSPPLPDLHLLGTMMTTTTTMTTSNDRYEEGEGGELKPPLLPSSSLLLSPPPPPPPPLLNNSSSSSDGEEEDMKKESINRRDHHHQEEKVVVAAAAATTAVNDDAERDRNVIIDQDEREKPPSDPRLVVVRNFSPSVLQKGKGRIVRTNTLHNNYYNNDDDDNNKESSSVASFLSDARKNDELLKMKEKREKEQARKITLDWEEMDDEKKSRKRKRNEDDNDDDDDEDDEDDDEEEEEERVGSQKKKKRRMRKRRRYSDLLQALNMSPEGLASANLFVTKFCQVTENQFGTIRCTTDPTIFGDNYFAITPMLQCVHKQQCWDAIYGLSKVDEKENWDQYMNILRMHNVIFYDLTHQFYIYRHNLTYNNKNDDEMVRDKHYKIGLIRENEICCDIILSLHELTLLMKAIMELVKENTKEYPLFTNDNRFYPFVRGGCIKM